MIAGVTLVDVLRVVGVVAALIGAIATAPSGFVVSVRGTRAAVLVVYARAWSVAQRLLRVPCHQTVSPVGIPAGMTSTRTLETIKTSAYPWYPNEPVAERIERLRTRIDEIARVLRPRTGRREQHSGADPASWSTSATAVQSSLRRSPTSVILAVPIDASGHKVEPSLAARAA
jgi:hypothetical protein